MDVDTLHRALGQTRRQPLDVGISTRPPTPSERERPVEFDTMQSHYHLAYREEEREMLPLCDEEDIGVIPWGPLGDGFLTLPFDDLEQTDRGDPENFHNPTADYTRGGGKEINERVAELADEYGVTMAQIALAWQFQNEYVDAPIVGTISISHLQESVEALDINLSDADIPYLEEPYEPQPIIGHERRLGEWFDERRASRPVKIHIIYYKIVFIPSQ